MYTEVPRDIPHDTCQGLRQTTLAIPYGGLDLVCTPYGVLLLNHTPRYQLTQNIQTKTRCESHLDSTRIKTLTMFQNNKYEEA